MRLKEYNDGLITLSGVKKEAVSQGNGDIIHEAYIEEISYKNKIEDYKGAIEAANEFMDVSDDDEIKAQVWFEIGKLNMQIGDVENAVTAFKNVFNYSPDFDLEFTANLHYGIALRESNKSEDALIVFEDMRDEDKYNQDFAEIDFEIAKTNRSLGKIEEAVMLFTEVDTLYRNTQTSAAAKYELGQIFEYEYARLDSAAFYYKKAFSGALPKEYLEAGREKNRLFTRYVQLDGDLSKFGKQLFYYENPNEYLKDSIAYVEDSLAIAEEISSIKELQEIWSGLDSLINVQDTTGFYSDTIRAIDSLIVNDTTLVKDTLLVKLYNPQPYDSAFVSKFDSLFTSPEFAKTRLVNINKAKQQFGKQTQLTNQLPDSLKFKNNPPRRPTISEDSLRTILSKTELEFGNLFLTELDIPDSAKWYYDNILTNYPDTKYEANTLYALGSYYLTVDDKRRADSLFNIIYEDYRNESIVNAAADKLNKPLIDLDYDPAKDNYEDAEYIMLSENYSDAIEQFYDIFKTYPGSPYAPKALHTAGWILENKLFYPDSAVAIYDTLVAHYPASVYVRNIAGKLSFFKQEQRRLRLAKQDSLSALNLASADSLTIDSVDQSFSMEFETISDTIQVAIQDEEEQKTEEKKPDDQNITTLPKIKEPLWNPRKRR
jgi:TolA-binding protein